MEERVDNQSPFCVFPSYKVHVSCMTFNHAPYITDTMNGFCMQKTTFPFVCTIFDDASTDGEPKVIQQYLQEHFDLEDHNVYRKETDVFSLVCARHKENANCFFLVVYLKYNHYSKGLGRQKLGYVKDWTDGVPYVALCEGDDYWIDPDKLQKQVDYLDGHAKCGLVWAKAKCYYQEKKSFKGFTGGYMSGYYDMFVNYNISPLTCMYRKSSIEGYYDFVKGQKWLLGDSPLFLYIAHDHDIHFMDEIVGVYRILSESACHSSSYEKTVRFKNSTFDVVKFFCEKYGHPNFKLLESIHYSYLFNYAFNDARYQTAKEIYKQIPYPNYKIRSKRIVLSSRVLRVIYRKLYQKFVR